MEVWEIALHKASAQKAIDIKIPSIMRFIKEYLEDYESQKLRNGRIIFNAVQSAVALAMNDKDGEDDKPRLTEVHLREVLKMSENFDMVMHHLVLSPLLSSFSNR